MNIRLYQLDDYGEIVKLWNDAGLILTLSDTKNELERFFKHNSESFFVLIDNKSIIGAVIGSFDGRRGFVHHLAVHPNYQGKGLGKLLMDHLTQYFIDQNIVKIHLMIERSNASVQSFYEQIGWHVRDDIILMSKSLRQDNYQVHEDRVELLE